MAKIKRELTLIESVVEHSKEIILIKDTIRAYKEALYRSSRTRFRPIDLASIRGIIKEYELKLDEARVHCANLMKAAYSKRYIVIGNRWHLSSTDMAAGFCWIIKEKVECILFLSKNEDAFLEPIEAGEIHPYEKVKDRLSKSKSVWKSNTIKELYLQKYQEIEDKDI